MSSTQPGSGDPYWYEWYVGLDNVINLIAGRNDISSVTFQEANLTGIDDVVIRYQDNRGATCYQVKFKKETTASARDITFATLVSNNTTTRKKALVGELAAGWKQLFESEGTPPNVILYSNRAFGMGGNTRSYQGIKYHPLPLYSFKEKIDKLLDNNDLAVDSELDSDDLTIQWRELLEAIDLPSTDACEFLRHLKLDLGMPGLDDAENNLIEHAQRDICGGDYELACRCFEALCFALSKWTVSGHGNTVTRQSAEEALLKLNKNPLEKPIDVEIPTPIFPSRQSFAEQICSVIERTDRAVIFIEAEPGAGKTRLVTNLCRLLNPTPIRFYSFRPLDVDQPSYSPDSGITDARDLWSTMLNQIRNELRDNNILVNWRIPVINELCTEDQLRSEVLRLSGVLAEHRNKPTVLIIDGIDHAARARSVPTYLQHLPAPDAIPDGVRIVLVGQPANSYDQYPMWLRTSNDSVEHFNLPRLTAEDASVLLEAQTPLCKDDAEEVAAALITQTRGNALSVVYAAHALKAERQLESAIATLEESGISDNVEEYYRFIWAGMAKSMEARNGEDNSMLIASCMYLLDGFISAKLLSDTFPDEYPRKYLAETDLEHLGPLLQKSEDGFYFPLHNDFRLYVSGMAKSPSNEPRLAYVTDKLASYMLAAGNSTIKSAFGVPTLIRAGRIDDAIELFDTAYVMTAVSRGVPWKTLSDQALLVYDAACKTDSLTKIHKAILSIETLGQINERFQYYLDVRPFLKLKQPTYLDFDVIPLSPESETVAAYVTTLRRCIFLQEEGTSTSAATIYAAWFNGKHPYSTARTILRRGLNSLGSIGREESETFFFLWGKYSALADVQFHELNHTSQKGDADIDDLIQSMRDGYACTTLEREPIAVVKERLERVRPSFHCCQEIIERHLSGESPLKRQNLIYLLGGIVAAGQTNALDATARTLMVIEDKPINDDRDLETALACIGDKQRFSCESKEADTYVVWSFLIGYARGQNSVQATVNEIRRLMDWVDSNDRSFPTFIQSTTAAACLGWHFAQDDIENDSLDEERLVIEKWLHSNNVIGYYSLSTLVILYVLLVPAKSRNLRLALDRKLLVSFASSRALACVLRVYEFLDEAEDINNLQTLLEQHYGKDGIAVLHSDDSRTIHKKLRPFLQKVNPELCSRCDAALEYNVSQVSDDHRDHALDHINDTFNSMLNRKAVAEVQARQLFALDKASRRPDGNYLADKTQESLLRWATAGGAKRLNQLRNWDAEFRFDKSALAALSNAVLAAAMTSDDIASAAALRIGVSSYYSIWDLTDCCEFLESCVARAKKLDVSREYLTQLIQMVPRYASGEANPLSNSVAMTASVLSEHAREKKKQNQRIRQLSTSALEDIAYIAPLDGREWNQAATACSCLVARKRTPEEVFTKFAIKRRLELASCGVWRHHSEALTYLTDAIADYSDDSAFLAVLAARRDNLTGYGYGSASDDLAYMMNRRAEKKAPELLAGFFADEFESKKLWLTANGKLPLNGYPPEDSTSEPPVDLASLVADSLTDLLVTQNPRMCEGALRGLAWGGLAIKGIRERVYHLYSSCTSSKRIMLLKLLAYWRDRNLDKDNINSIFECSLTKSKRLDETSLLCVLLNKPKVKCLAKPTSPSYTTNKNENSYVGRGNRFLGCIERSKGPFDALRTELATLPSTEENFAAKPFTLPEDIYCPRYTRETLEEEALYFVCYQGEFGELPSDSAASLLIDPSDIWAIAATPMIIDAETTGISSLLESLTRKDSLDIDEVKSIARQGILNNESLLGWEVYLPYGYDNEYIAFGTLRMRSNTTGRADEGALDKEFGCYSILSKTGGGIRSYFDFDNSLSLCNEVTGSFSLMWGDVQLVPSSAMRSLGFGPRDNNPLEWVDENGTRALKFTHVLCIEKERYDGRQVYYRQPQIWRWVCNVELLKWIRSTTGHDIYESTEISNGKDPMKQKLDNWRAEASSSPL